MSQVLFSLCMQISADVDYYAKDYEKKDLLLIFASSSTIKYERILNHTKSYFFVIRRDGLAMGIEVR